MVVKLFRVILLSFIIIYPLFNHTSVQAANSLVAKIDTPYHDSIIRGDVPVFGEAYGKDFKEFILDYGEGKNPTKWVLINKSAILQTKYRLSAGMDMTSFGKTIDGNLGTWRTGLDEYEYGEHPVNLLGIYTLRLRVFDREGNVAEDRIAVEVGRVVLTSIGGEGISTDSKARFLVREHSLLFPFILISLKPIDETKITLPSNLTLTSRVYELRPPEEKFIQEATLSIDYNPNFNPQNLGIYYFDTDKEKWQLLESWFNEKEKAIESYILETPSKYALYGVFASDKKIITEAKQQLTPLKEKSAGLLFYRNDFEDPDLAWDSYTLKGAKLSLASGKDGKCLEVVNQDSPSPFSSLITDEAFNAKEFPFIKFDYKIPEDVKVNFLVKAGKKWFDIEFTDDKKIYWDVNITSTGKIENVIADNKWHSTCFNLYDMFKGHTKDYTIEKFIMADFDVGGFMKLEFGKNRHSAAYYIDNFTIALSAKELAARAWKALDAKNFIESAKNAQTCIDIYSSMAIKQQAGLVDFPKKEEIHNYRVLNEVAVCYFILAEVLRLEDKIDEAKNKYQYITQNFPYAQCWDSRGWFWKIAEVALDRIITFETGYEFGNYASEFLTNKAWASLDKKDYRGVELYAQKVIYLYEEEAKKQQASLKDFAPKSFIPYYWALNNVGTCYFILGESCIHEAKYKEAKKIYKKIIEDFSYARCWDPRGWFWKVAKRAREHLLSKKLVNLKD